MKVLDTMLSEDAQNQILYDGQDLLSYSQDVDIHLTEYLKDVKPVIEENHMYIRIASNDFFSISKDVVSKMIAGEYDAGQAYQSFNTQLLNQQTISEISCWIHRNSIPIVSMPVEVMQPIRLWQIRCAVSTGRMC